MYKVLSILLFTLLTIVSNAQLYTPKGVGGGGGLSGFSMSPYNNLWFVGTDMGTLYRSADQGANWYPVDHYEATFSNDLPNAAYLGFHPDGNTIFHSYEGCIPKRSTDGGLTWTDITSLINLLPTTGYAYADCKNDANNTRIRYWLANSMDGNVVFAASGDGLFRSADAGITWARVSGVSGNSKGTFIDYATNPHTVYHASESTIYQSLDAGLTFSIYHTASIRSFTGGRDASGLTLAFIDNNDAACSSFYSNRYGNSNLDCGYVWTEEDGGGFIQNTKYGGDWIRMAENDAQTIWVTGARVWNLSYGTQVWTSTDRGQNWAQKFQQLLTISNPWTPWPASNFEHSAVGLDVGYDDAGYRSFSVNRRNSAIGGGTGNYFLHISRNTGNFWESPFTNYADVGPREEDKKWATTGLDPTSAWLLEFHPVNRDVAYCGFADIGGIATEDGGQTWRICKAIYNSLYDFAFDPADDRVVWGAVSSLHDFPYGAWGNYNLTQPGGIYHSSDRGKNWTQLTPNGDFHTSFLSVAYDATNNVLYGGTKGFGVARSTDGGTTWEWFNTGLPAWPKIITQIEIDPDNQDVYLLMTADKPDFTDISQTGIYKLNTNTTTWELLRTTVNDPPQSFIGPLWKYPVHFSIDWNDPSRQKMWMTDMRIPGTYKASGIWYSGDGGTTWDQKLPFANPHRITIDPCDPNLVYVNGLSDGPDEGGPQYSTDYGTTWQKNLDLPMQNNLTAVTIDVNDPSQVYYTHFGGGILHGSKPSTTTCLPVERSKKVFAHYLPWYDGTSSQGTPRRGWCYEGDCTDLANIHYSNSPRIGEYSQFDSEVLEYHIFTAFVAGIDGFIINLNPSSDYQKNITNNLLNELNTLRNTYPELVDFKIIISYDNGSATPSDITNYFTYVHDNIYKNPTYEDLIFRDELTNKQVLQTWSESDPAAYYQNAQTLWGKDSILLMVRNAVNFDHADANFGWVNYLVNDPLDNSSWGEPYFNDFDWAMARQPEFGLTTSANVNTLMMGMVYPGFNDENVPTFWNGGTSRYLQRNVTAGETMSLTWDKQMTYTEQRLGGYINVENPWVQIITWNDWPEGTSIEPATDDTYGFQALETNHTKIGQCKGNTAYAVECLDIAYLIYEARQQGALTEANAATTLLLNGQCNDARLLLDPVLPVEVIDFQAKCNDNGIELQWKTLYEDKLNYFEIQQSLDGENWIPFGRTMAKHIPSNYTFSLEHIRQGNTYFRLKIVEEDDSFTFSKILVEKCSTFSETTVHFYPNPSQGDLTFEFDNIQSKEVSIRILDVAGKVAINRFLSLNNKSILQLEDLNLEGLFFVEVITGEKVLRVGKVVFW